PGTLRVLANATVAPITEVPLAADRPATEDDPRHGLDRGPVIQPKAGA
ncbi:MAG: hypothetical protein QOJ75_1214, partial [Chloroflexota bacterium]|nr:hypothetical protein [Chloroflexota bacterium]